MNEIITNHREVAQALKVLHNIHNLLPDTSSYTNEISRNEDELEYTHLEAFEMFCWCYEKAFRFPAQYTKIPNGMSWFENHPTDSDANQVNVIVSVVTHFLQQSNVIEKSETENFQRILHISIA